MLTNLKYWAKGKIKKETPLRQILEKINLLCWQHLPSLFEWDLNKKEIMLNITLRCNLSCYNCNRSAIQAPSNEDLSPEQVKRFIKESTMLNWKWKRIALIGGEPTLHPKLFEIIDIISKYKEINPSCNFRIVTNGCGREVREVLSDLPEWIEIINSNKESIVQKFSSFNIAPIDLKKYTGIDFSRGCPITENCGVGFSRHGYYPCGVGTSVDRVIGFDIGIKKLSHVSDSKLKNQLALLCRYCGHFKDNYGEKKITEQMISPSWQKAYEKYKKSKPKLSLY